ncbi:hypothetical protein [Halomonas caseinilytica]|nr:hypothetical protein [Halomonas caseinilytica]
MKGTVFLISVVALLVILSGCAASIPDKNNETSRGSSFPSWMPSDAKRETYSLTPEEVNVAKEKVKSQLKDPESARFGDKIYGTREVGNASGENAVCGTVNAKNGFGGYAGEVRFAIFNDDVFLPTEMLSHKGLAVLRLCKT